MTGATGLALCLLAAASPAALPPHDDGPRVAGEIALAAQQVQLRWTHSIERVRWEETYRLVGPGAPAAAAPCTVPAQPALCLLRARVQGSGAGMEPAPSAVWRDGGLEWGPAPTAVAALRLMHSPYVADYTLCLDGHCQALTQWLGPAGAAAADAVVRLRACAP